MEMDFLKSVAEALKPLNPPAEVSEVIGLSVDRLASLRIRGGGPLFVKMNSDRRGKVFYPKEAILDWLSKRLVASTSVPVPKAQFETGNDVRSI